MNLTAPAPARTALRRFRACSPSTRVHVRIRWLTCPLPAVAAVTPTAGRVLDVGCGHGLLPVLLAEGSPDRSVVGVDVDGAKIAEGRRAAAGLGGRVTLRAVPSDWDPSSCDGRFDAVVVTDVLYLLGRQRALALLRGCASLLAGPGARLIVKEIDTEPRWKYRLAVGQELAATRIARITRGDRVDFAPPGELAATMTAAGLGVERRRVDAGFPHPHLLLVGTAP